MHSDPVIIPLKRSRIFSSLFFSTAILCFCIWALLYDGSIENFLLNNAIVKYVMVFFLLASLVIGLPMTIKLLLLGSRAKIEIDSEGIKNHTVPLTIRWEDITDISIKEKMNHKFLVIRVHHPDEYLENATPFVRRMMKINQKNHGTPLTLSPIGFHTDISRLYMAVERKWAEYKSSERG